MLHLLITIVVGGIVGWLASIVMKTNQQMGIIANVLVGIVGSVLGHWIFGLLRMATFGAIGRLIVSILGAMALIYVLKALKIFK